MNSIRLKELLFLFLVLLSIPFVLSKDIVIPEEGVYIVDDKMESTVIETTYYRSGFNLIASDVEVDGVNQRKYYHRDRVGNVRAISDNLIESLGRAKTLPFGQQILNDFNEKMIFTGKELDESGLYNFDARFYDSEIGRFTSVDPIDNGHDYLYVNNNPMNYVDPDGRAGIYVSYQNVPQGDLNLGDGYYLSENPKGHKSISLGISFPIGDSERNRLNILSYRGTTSNAHDYPSGGSGDITSSGLSFQMERTLIRKPSFQLEGGGGLNFNRENVESGGISEYTGQELKPPAIESRGVTLFVDGEYVFNDLPWTPSIKTHLGVTEQNRDKDPSVIIPSFDVGIGVNPTNWLTIFFNQRGQENKEPSLGMSAMVQVKPVVLTTGIDENGRFNAGLHTSVGDYSIYHLLRDFWSFFF